MPDREKVIKGLEICTTRPCYCKDCPYAKDCALDSQQLMEDALAMLKEQEAVEPKKVKGYNPPMYTLYEYECKECKSPMMNKEPFCMGCGKLVKWE